MKVLQHFLVLISCLSLAILVRTDHDRQSVFISLDCGSPADSTYTESKTGIEYISDAHYIQTGTSRMILEEYRATMPQQAWYVRSFPEGVRNCYNITLRTGDKYLIRAYFVYGNYDGKHQVPRFDLHLGPNSWGTVNLPEGLSNETVMDIIHVIPSNHLQVCLVNTGSGIPFISSLELRLLENSTYKTKAGSLEYRASYDVGSTERNKFRYNKDFYDRIWWPHTESDWTQINTSLDIDSSNNVYQPPVLAMRTAATHVNASHSLDFIFDSDDPIWEIYVYMHFAEVEKLQANESRKFKISYNGEHLFGPYSPDYLQAGTYPFALTGSEHKFSFYRTEDSTHPPILNAIEIYSVKYFPQSETVQKDVDAILNIKSTYGLKRNWEGDPCAPQEFLWEGLNCSYNGHDPPSIISLDISSSGLTGQIPSSIKSLNQLEYLDLSDNNLTGPVPEFLSQLQFLRELNLEGNMLSGKIPSKLLERSQNGLTLRVGGNPNLCASSACKQNDHKKSVVVPVVAAVASFSVLIIVLTILWRLKMRKPKTQHQDGDQVNATSVKTSVSLETKKRLFAFAEVQRMTNNFERIIGRGGFGTVFHGYLEGTQVAVKMLSPSSVQGHKQFQAEVKLLLRVYHRNLTTLIGYCNEGSNLGLIYEYMARGNLAEHLSARSASILSWERRLQIALDAAQGLEYLHNGCKPPIIHRDVKSTNILLNEDFQAKLADFGLSKTFQIEGDTHVSASIAGTPGYFDPEYYITLRLTEKSDVYGFGIVLLEIITSRPVITRTNSERTNLSQWVSSMLSLGDIKNIVDPRLQGYDVNTVWKAVEVAMACLSPTSARRPTMNQVVTELSECLSAERSRNRRDDGNESQDSVGLMTMNLDIQSLPIAR